MKVRWAWRRAICARTESSMKVERLSLSSSTASAASRRCGSTRSDGRVAVLAGARLRRICDADCTRRCGIANAGAPMGAGDQEPSGAGPRSAGSWVWGGALGYGFAGEARSEEHTSELQSLMRISYAVFCWKKKQ